MAEFDVPLSCFGEGNDSKVSLPVIVEPDSSAHRCGEQHSPGGSPRGGRHL